MDQPPPAEYCLLWIQWWPLCMQKGEWASWVQGIGSIAAIAAAFAVGNSQIRAARAQRREEQQSGVRILQALLANAINSTNIINSDFERLRSPTARANAEYWLEWRRQLADVDPFKLPSSDLVFAIAALPRELQLLYDVFLDFERAITMGPQRTMSQKYGLQLEKTLRLLQKAHDECERYLASAH